MPVVASLPMLVAATLLAVPAAVQESAPEPPVGEASTTVIVDLADGTPTFAAGEALDLLGGGDIELVAAHDNLGLLTLEVSRRGSEVLDSTSIVDSVTPSRVFDLFLDESVPAIGVADLHAGGTRGAGRTVAVLDSGVDSALAGSVVAEACFLQGATSVVQGCGNGASLTAVGPGSAMPCSALAEECSHGTHVAGIISGDDTTYTGVAPDAGLIAIRVTAVVSGPSTQIPEAGVLAGLDHVLGLASTFDIAAVNLSLGGPAGTCSDSLWEGVVAELTAAGIAVVAASGNSADLPLNPDRNVAFPACLDDVIAVGATGPSAEVTAFSQYLGGLDLVAPGVLVDSTVLTSLDASGFAAFTGTSMAAPHVAASFALIDGSHPGWSVERYMELLRATGVMVTRPTPDPFDRDPRFPEVRPSAVLGFTPFSDADFGFWVIASDWAKATGVSIGPGGGVFDPDPTLSRAEGVTFLWRLMGEAAPVSGNPFADVPNDVWFTDPVVWAFEVGITTGTAATTFEPANGVTRGQVAAFLWRMVGEPKGSPASGFSDVAPGAFYTTAVDWMAVNGITTGTTATTFSPDDLVTRAQMITFLWRLVNASSAWSGAVAPPSSVMF